MRLITILFVLFCYSAFAQTPDNIQITTQSPTAGSTSGNNENTVQTGWDCVTCTTEEIINETTVYLDTIVRLDSVIVGVLDTTIKTIAQPCIDISVDQNANITTVCESVFTPSTATVTGGSGINNAGGNRYTVTFPNLGIGTDYKIKLQALDGVSPNALIPDDVVKTATSVTFGFYSGDDGGGVDDAIRTAFDLEITGCTCDVLADIEFAPASGGGGIDTNTQNTVSAGANVTVTPTTNANGTTNYQVSSVDTDTQLTDAEVCSIVGNTCNSSLSDFITTPQANGDVLVEFSFTDNAGVTENKSFTIQSDGGGGTGGCLTDCDPLNECFNISTDANNIIFNSVSCPDEILAFSTIWTGIQNLSDFATVINNVVVHPPDQVNDADSVIGNEGVAFGTIDANGNIILTNIATGQQQTVCAECYDDTALANIINNHISNDNDTDATNENVTGVAVTNNSTTYFVTITNADGTQVSTSFPILGTGGGSGCNTDCSPTNENVTAVTVNNSGNSYTVVVTNADGSTASGTFNIPTFVEVDGIIGNEGATFVNNTNGTTTITNIANGASATVCTTCYDDTDVQNQINTIDNTLINHLFLDQDTDDENECNTSLTISNTGLVSITDACGTEAAQIVFPSDQVNDAVSNCTQVFNCLPADLQDGDQNTQLSETQVDNFVSNNGYFDSCDDLNGCDVQDLGNVTAGANGTVATWQNGSLVPTTISPSNNQDECQILQNIGTGFQLSNLANNCPNSIITYDQILTGVSNDPDWCAEVNSCVNIPVNNDNSSTNECLVSIGQNGTGFVFNNNGICPDPVLPFTAVADAVFNDPDFCNEVQSCVTSTPLTLTDSDDDCFMTSGSPYAVVGNNIDVGNGLHVDTDGSIDLGGGLDYATAICTNGFPFVITTEGNWGVDVEYLPSIDGSSRVRTRAYASDGRNSEIWQSPTQVYMNLRDENNNDARFEIKECQTTGEPALFLETGDVDDGVNVTGKFLQAQDADGKAEWVDLPTQPITSVETARVIINSANANTTFSSASLGAIEKDDIGISVSGVNLVLPAGKYRFEVIPNYDSNVERSNINCRFLYNGVQFQKINGKNYARNAANHDNTSDNYVAEHESAGGSYRFVFEAEAATGTVPIINTANQKSVVLIHKYTEYNVMLAPN